ncbi:MAG: hypothetical protein A3K19_04250 [Lentisphaerae bacterium RIFOXYB12_FULL_65_16]|nr:MAG: hypothetical protein A3K18_09445 [Lentisphaerae bacterium RIFOXYA12_64_32]OGV84295.1 MAG: hypothetical protein A3K19_04250 [Lentisphaerae bacterium RIFOXYB12_FULL_65_16]
MDTPRGFNTIDADGPTSSVNALPAVSPSDIPVSWTGTDDDGGAGIAGFDVYVSVDAGPWELWLDNTAANSATYPGTAGLVYSFYCIATDWVGHTEVKAPVVEATTTANAMPRIALADPAPHTMLNTGDTYVITWIDSDPDSSATISLYWDTDTNAMNNTESVPRESGPPEGGTTSLKPAREDAAAPRDLAAWGVIAEGNGGGSYAQVDAIEAKTGVWAYAPTAVRGGLTVRGRPLRDYAVVLHRGWNLIAPTATCVYPDLSQVPGPAWYWDGDAALYRSVPHGGQLLTGRAYWVYATRDVTLTLGP